MKSVIIVMEMDKFQRQKKDLAKLEKEGIKAWSGNALEEFERLRIDNAKLREENKWLTRENRKMTEAVQNKEVDRDYRRLYALALGNGGLLGKGEAGTILLFDSIYIAKYVMEDFNLLNWVKSVGSVEVVNFYEYCRSYRENSDNKEAFWDTDNEDNFYKIVTDLIHTNSPRLSLQKSGGN